MNMDKYKTELKDINELKTFYNESGTNRKKMFRITKYSLLSKAFMIGLLILNITIIYFAIVKNHEMHQLRVEIDELKRDMSFVYQFLDKDYFDEMNKAMENEDYIDDANSETDFDSEFNGTYEYPDDEINSIANDYVISNKGQGHHASPSAKHNIKSRNKREMLSATIDGVPIISESYAQRKRNRTAQNRNGIDTLVLYESLGKSKTTNTTSYNNNNIRASTVAPRLNQQQHTSPQRQGGWSARTYVHHGRHQKQIVNAAPTPIISRTSRVMYTNNDDIPANKRFRKTVRRSQQQFQEQVQGPEMTIPPGAGGHRRKKHGSNLETMDEKHHARTGNRFIAAVHFTGNMEKYEHSHSHHPHYEGNGRLRHPEGLYIDWHPSTWVKTLGMDRLYQMHNGTLTIKETGLYFIYAQIYYLDKHDKNGYRIYKNDKYLAQCTITAHSEKNLTKANTCYTSVVDYLQEGDQIMIKDIEKLRYVFFDHASSFFGLVKLTHPKTMK